MLFTGTSLSGSLSTYTKFLHAQKFVQLVEFRQLLLKWSGWKQHKWSVQIPTQSVRPSLVFIVLHNVSCECESSWFWWIKKLAQDPYTVLVDATSTPRTESDPRNLVKEKINALTPTKLMDGLLYQDAQRLVSIHITSVPLATNCVTCIFNIFVNWCDNKLSILGNTIHFNFYSSYNEIRNHDRIFLILLLHLQDMPGGRDGTLLGTIDGSKLGA